MAYQPSRNLYLPDFADAAIGGFQAGQQIRGSALDEGIKRRQMQREQQELQQQQQILGARQAYLGGGDPTQLQMYDPKGLADIQGTQATQQQTQREDMARGANDILNAPVELAQGAYSRYREMLKATLGETEEGLLEDGLTPELTDNARNALQMAVRGGQDIEDIIPSQEQERKEALEERKQGLAERKFNQEIVKFNRKMDKGDLEPKEIFNRETKLRREFTKLSGDFIKQRDALGRIQASASEPSAAGDLALIFNYMKLLDPGSTVREGEFANAQNSGSVPDTIRARYNKVSRGERLSKRQRGDFVDRADKIFNTANTQHEQRVGQFTGLAQRAGVNPQQVLVELGLAGQNIEEQTQNALQQGYTHEEVNDFLAKKRNRK